MRCLMAITAALIAISAGFPASAADTAHLAFVSEYVRELGEYENALTQSRSELGSDANLKLLTVIRGSTRVVLTLGTAVNNLSAVRLGGDFADLAPGIITFYQRRIQIHQRLIQISTVFLSEQKAGTDYGALAAEMPRHTAALEFIDKSLFEMTPLVFTTLIDMRADKEGHASHLIITKAERSALIDSINNEFGNRLDDPNRDTTANTALLLRDFLKKDFKASDDPW